MFGEHIVHVVQRMLPFSLFVRLMPDNNSPLAIDTCTQYLTGEHNTMDCDPLIAVA